MKWGTAGQGETLGKGGEKTIKKRPRRMVSGPESGGEERRKRA